ncbi:Kinesin-like protein kif3b [Nowakowskiella sp. JEL0407]|nr:Kinesin-like protein kif3b [Nowakowskiella sp. JEL0407]
MSEREAVKVIVRCRPFSEKEKAAGHSNIVTIDQESATVSIRDPRSSDVSEVPKTFTFDSLFDNNCAQIDVYNTCARPIVDSVLQGYNGTIFAYGQTGTGKTFSMEGIRDVPHLRGIIPNSFDHIFNHISLSPASTQYLVRASYLEIYNEDIRDLLNPGKGKLEIKERADTGVYVKDLSTFVVKDIEEMDRLMAVGNKNRSVGATAMNAQSSRSHSIFTITIEASETDDNVGPSTDGASKSGGEARIRAGKLHLVDLAGSERQSKTGAEGSRLKEATKINLSLSALGNVISALVDGKSSHIPYRDSKLTRLLQDSLGGNARTLMIATMSPASYNYDETISTLRYANRAKNIKNKPKVNEDPKDAMLREFQEEIKKLKAELENMGDGGEPIIREIVEEEEVEEEEDDGEDESPTADSAGQSQKADQPAKKPKSDKPKKKKDRSIPSEAQKEATHHIISEAQLAEMQRLVEAEKKSIMESKDMEESEKNRLLAEADKRAAEIEQERKNRETIEQKLEQLQQKLLAGGVNMLDKDAEQQMLLARQAQELEERRRVERELQRELEEHEETNLQIEEEYVSLQEEAAAKGRKLKKLWGLIMSAKSEVKDLQEEHQREREDLLETIRDLTRELKLRMLVVNSFIPSEELALLESCAEYDEAAEKWRIPHIAHAGNNIRGKRSLVTGQPIGLHRDTTKRDEIEQDMWNPMCVFPDVFLLYENPTSSSRKRDKRNDKISLKKSLKRSPTRNGGESSRDGSRSPTKGERSSKMERNATGSQNSEEQGIAHPSARGLVAKPKHYA